VKADLEKQYGIPYAQQKLVCAGKQLIDPFSLSDCAGIKAAAGNAVEVTVEQAQQ
jgi:hypothetical protein